MSELPERAYVLRSGDPAVERLRVLARARWPSTRRLLKKVGIAPGLHCQLEHIQEAVMEQGLVSAEEFQARVGELQRFADNPRTILSLPRIFQVWGMKKG
jgi:hypothetical protein